MNTPSLRRLSAVLALVLAGVFAAPAPAAARTFGGGGGGGGRAAASGHFVGGYRGGYGWRGGWGWGWRGGYWGWGWGWGWPGYGLFLATLPYYYSTVWWNGVPYYYADDTYYTWNASVGQYESVLPPAGLVNPSAGPSPGAAPGGPQTAVSDLIAYPKNGQTPQQQAQDKLECRRWAATQAGVDANRVNTASNAVTTLPASQRELFMRAESACFEGRGYSVR